jgi:hypothetical protein
MDDIYWLTKAVRQQNATIRRLVRWLVRPRTELTSGELAELEDGLDGVNSCLDHIDTKVFRG